MIKAPKYAPPPHAKRMAQLAEYHGVPPRASAGQRSQAPDPVPAIDFATVNRPASGAAASQSQRPQSGGAMSQTSQLSPNRHLSQSQRSYGSGAPRSPLPGVKPVTPKPNARPDK